jgi:hypothetical protein
VQDREILPEGVRDFPVLHFLPVFDFISHFYQLFLFSCLFVNFSRLPCNTNLNVTNFVNQEEKLKVQDCSCSSGVQECPAGISYMDNILKHEILLPSKLNSITIFFRFFKCLNGQNLIAL